MRIFTSLVFLLLAACSAGEPETHMTSADVDLAAVPAMLAAIDSITDDDLRRGQRSPQDRPRTIRPRAPLDDCQPPEASHLGTLVAPVIRIRIVDSA